MKNILTFSVLVLLTAACDDDSCLRDCEDRECGDDGCGGLCGQCDDGVTCSSEGLCELGCTPDCGTRLCGDDRCGGDCGQCDDDETCSSEGLCELTCSPDCGTRHCGGDGCGGLCGECGDDLMCDSPSGTCSKRASVMVPMRDGVELDTLVVLPEVAPPYPTLLIRTPYVDIGARAGAEMSFAPFLSDGFALVNQSVRGTGASDGELMPLVQEFDDGEDMADWLVDQPWSDGNIGTLGGSYEGFTAMAAAVRSPHVKVAIPDGYLSHIFRSWPVSHEGVLSWSLLWWLHLVETGEDLFQDIPTLTTVTNSRPVISLDEVLFDVEVPLWQDLAEHMEQDNDFWLDWSFDDELHELCTPVLLLEAATEGEDDMLDSYLSLMSSTCSEEDRQNQRFVLGDHDHTGAIYQPFAVTPTGELIRGYLEAFLKGSPEALDGKASVTAFIQGANEWVTAPEWPLHDDQEVFYLDAEEIVDGMASLTPSAPSSAGVLSYVFDPDIDDACSPFFSKVAYFASSPLSSPLQMLGRAELTVYMTLDAPDADLFAYLFEIPRRSPDWNIVSIAALRLRFRESMSDPVLVVPGLPFEARLEFVATGYQFAEGSQVALIISSSECGHPENPNTGGPMMTETSTQPVTVEILSGPERPTQLTLPVLR